MRLKLYTVARFMREFNPNPMWLEEADRIEAVAETGTVAEVEAETQRLVNAFGRKWVRG